MNKLYALLIGINKYISDEIPNLSGCENDLQKVLGFLQSTFKKETLSVKTLINEQATYKSIINTFRSHLGQAGSDDSVLIYYCGHGSRTRSAPEFQKYQSDGKDEVLVCHDAWSGGDNILADREIAVLLSEAARNNPHLVMIADCCNSGSITRDISDCTSRFVNAKDHKRELSSYLEGYFVDKKLDALPRSTHLLISASENMETAKEGNINGTKGGFFTQALIETLTESGGELSYTDLFTRVRSKVQVFIKEAGATSQTPQFENYEHFDPDTLFLTGKKSRGAKSYSVTRENNSWTLGHGLAYGLPDAPETEITVAVYSMDESDEKCLTYGTITEPGQKTSVLSLDKEEALDPGTQYKARIISMPLSPLDIYLHGDQEKLHELTALFPDFLHCVNREIPCKIGLRLENEQFTIYNRDSGQVYLTESYRDSRGESNDAYLIGQLTRIEQWERLARLQNNRPKLDPALFKVLFCSQGTEHEAAEEEIIQKAHKNGGEYDVIPYTIKVKNESTRNLFCILLYFSKDFGIYSLYNGKIQGSSDFVVIDDMHELGLPEESSGKL